MVFAGRIETTHQQPNIYYKGVFEICWFLDTCTWVLAQAYGDCRRLLNQRIILETKLSSRTFYTSE